MNVSFIFSVLGVALTGSMLLGQDTQSVTLDHKLQIPGAVLKPGAYTFAVEDRLQDRAIIRITNTKKNSHELVLAVPSDKLNQPEHGKLIFFAAANSDKQILQGWMCPSCQTALEVVYPKNDAVKITGETAKAVMAVDPTYDKLPKNLSPDDMKVVTLWLLSPKEITPEQKGKGVEAAKYADLKNKPNTQIAIAPPQPETKATTANDESQKTAASSSGAVATANSNAATTATAEPAKTPEPAPVVLTANQAEIATAAAKPAAARNLNRPTELAGARRMPHTASNTYNWGLAGFMLLVASIGSYLQRRFSSKLVRARE